MDPTPFGKYTLEEQIAEGGMAIVYRASLAGPHGFTKQLCIKQIKPELAARPEFLQLFIAEAKLTVALSHANIVPVYELGRVDDVYYLALEYIDGVTLGTLMSTIGTLTVPMALGVVEQILRGLDYAHRRGVVHRDMSPANVLVSNDGEIRLTDFGIAQAVGSAGIKGGSRGYSAPEQERGADVDVRADIYAVGIILAELVGGKRAGDDFAGVPSAVVDICRRAAAPEVEQRYSDAATMLRDVTRALREFSVPSPSALSQEVLSAARKRRRSEVPSTTRATPRTRQPQTKPAIETFATRLAEGEPAKRTTLLARAVIGLALLAVAAAAANHYLRTKPTPTSTLTSTSTPTLTSANTPTLTSKSTPTLTSTPTTSTRPSASPSAVAKKRGVGLFTLGSTPWSHARIDDEWEADTPIVRRPLAEGTHTVVLTEESTHRTLRFTVTTLAGKETKWLADFRDEPRVERVVP